MLVVRTLDRTNLASFRFLPFPFNLVPVIGVIFYLHCRIGYYLGITSQSRS